MIERILLALALAAVGYLAFAALTAWHKRRIGQTAESQPALLYFHSDSCAACPTQAHFVAQAAEMLARPFALRQIDAEHEAEESRRYGVFSLPTTIVVDGAGAVKHINYGLTHSAKLVQQLESVL